MYRVGTLFLVGNLFLVWLDHFINVSDFLNKKTMKFLYFTLVYFNYL